MQFTIATVLSLLTITLAAPTNSERQVPYTPCSGLYGTAQCCATDVLGVADLDCANREFSSTYPASPPAIEPFNKPKY